MTGIDTMIWLAVAGCALLALPAIAMVVSPRNREDRKRAARMHALDDKADRAALMAIVHRRKPRTWSDQIPLVGDLSKRLLQAGVHVSPQVFVAGCAVLALLLSIAGYLLAGAVTLPGAVLAGFSLPLLAVNSKRAKRKTAFALQLPDALDLMQRGLRVGHPISVTVASVGKTMPDPMGHEFRILTDQISHGEYLADAFNDLADRIDQEDMDYLSVAISIQHGTGGNLAEMLSTLSKVVRDRIMMRRRVAAISSEGRMSAYFLSAMPVGIYLATSLTAPDYYDGVKDDPIFMPIAALIVALVVGNALALRALVNFKL